jgi:hypothetical protein
MDWIDNKLFVTCSGDKTAKVWEVEKLECVKNLTVSKAPTLED